MNAPDDKADWQLLRVAPGFEALFDALERAERKGYLPDAIKEHFDGWQGYTCAPDSHYSNERREFQNARRPNEPLKSDLHIDLGRVTLYERNLCGIATSGGKGETVRAAIDTARKAKP